jgi:hypothetical protein
MKQQVKISKVKGNPSNPRIIKNDKFKTLKHSIRTMPGYMKLRPVIVDEDMMVLGGNMRLKASIDLGKKEIWTDMFTQADCDDMNKIAIEEERETKTYLEYCDAIIIKDNVSSGEWEWDILANEWDSVQLADWGLDVWQNEDDVKEEEVYTKNIEAPTYEPKNEKPKEEELYNEDKVKELIKKIGLSNIEKEEKEFLIKAAYRHTVFNYQSIADFYAHSNKEVQELMEDSALVIIDFNKAIENGYVKLSKELEKSYTEDYEK